MVVTNRYINCRKLTFWADCYSELMSDLVLIFDADCAFCQACVRWGNRNLRGFPRAVGFQNLDLTMGPVTLQQAQQSIWLVSTANSDFTPLPANRAAAFILKNDPNPLWRLLGFAMDLRGIRVIARFAYFKVAKNRAKLPGATEACELPQKVQ
jgi:predicted DCC family thiol-disulfide oxidoreductase YuxK